ncbi:MAG: DUF2461 domain-containing protein [Myxococcales bacterium]|nr:DUF2461 domain-containing protein [Myxococcales bacterium]
MTKTQPSFSGFPKQTLSFLDGLQENNNRDWFTAHKADYDQYVKLPAELFLNDMSERFHTVFGIPFSGKIFRIHRDVRFSKDKTPYNCHVHMSFFPAASEKHDCGDKPAFHFGLEPTQVVLGTGCFEFSKEVLDQYRQDVVSETRGKELQTTIDHLVDQGGYRLGEPALQRVPRGMDPTHPREGLLRQKGLLVWHNSSPDDLTFTAKDAERWMERYLHLKPIYDWLNHLTH